MAAKIFLDLPGGLKMPALGLGTYEEKEENELVNALNTALELGYRHIDTATMYRNEHVIGRVLKQWLDSGKLKREDLFITTKLSHGENHPDKVEAQIKLSLEKLQLNYVDLYLMHGPLYLLADEKTGWFQKNDKGEYLSEPIDHLAIWKKMEEQVDAGRAKTIGLSNFNIRQIDRILKNCRIKPANLQVELHVYVQQPELVDFCHKNNITVVAYSPLGRPGFNVILKAHGLEERELPDVLGNPVLAKVAKKHAKSPAQVAIRFLLELGTATIPRSVRAKRLAENMDVFDFKLDSEDMKALRALNVGDEARLTDMKGLEKDPEYPF